MLTVIFMVTRRPGAVWPSVALCLTLSASACEKVPLLAPTGSTITLTPSANVVAANGSVDILAQVIEAAGTPPHSGTRVTFTTTLGRMEPPEASTDSSGRARVKFIAGASNGAATINALSGGANTGASGAI